MARLLSIATGNLTTAGTWGTIDATSYLNAENSTESLLTTNYSDTRSSAFTTGAIEISGIAVKLCERIGTTGTMSVHLEKDSDDSEVVGTEVTINVADLPAATESALDGGWIYFKFASPVTLADATAYQVAAKTSSANMVDLWTDATVDNLSRCLVTTTTAAPTTGDDVIITGSKTGAGTETEITVTMDNTDTTDFGAAPADPILNPSVAICDGGILTYGATAATNYMLKLSGNVIVYSGGLFNIGTTGTPIPRDSTAKLNFDCASSGQFGMILRNGGSFVAQGLSRTSGKNIYYCLLNTDEAVNQTILGVDTDTGWLDNDEIGIAATSKTYTQNEKGTLNGNAASDHLDVDGFAGAGGGLAYAHSGTAPAQAEVVLLTRNVKIYGASAAYPSYIVAYNTANVDMDWVELYWMGASGHPKIAGLYLYTTTGTVNVQYCSFHNFEAIATAISGIYMNSSSAAITVSKCVLYNIYQYGIYISNTSGVCTITDNIVIYLSQSASQGITLTGDALASTVTGNRVVATNSSGFYLTGAIQTLGTFANNVSHSNDGYGLFQTSGQFRAGTMSNLLIYRNEGEGFYLGGGGPITIEDSQFFGNNTNVNLIYGAGTVFDNCTFNGDSSHNSTYGMQLGTNSYGNVLRVKLINCTFGGTSGILRNNTQYDIYIINYLCELYLVNTSLLSTTEFSDYTQYFVEDSFISSQKHDGTKGLHKTLKRYGAITIDTTAGLFRTASPSQRLTPNNASGKLRSSTFRVNVNDGQTCTPSVYVRESVVGDGTDYNGNRIRLILKRNDAVGITEDVVIDTATVSSEGAYEQLTGTTAAVTDDGVLEFYIDCDGTTGWINIDDFTATVA